jgi:precorrin-4 methylase
MNGTSPQAEKILFRQYRLMAPEAKLQQVVALSQMTQKMALTRLREQYGSMSEREERIRLAALWLPRETMIKFLGWDPVEKGY